MGVWEKLNDSHVVPATLADVCASVTGKPCWTTSGALNQMHIELTNAPKASPWWPARKALYFFVNHVGIASMVLCGVTFAACVALTIGWVVGLYVDPISKLISGFNPGLAAWCTTAIVYPAAAFVLSAAIFIGMCAAADTTIRGPAKWVSYSFDDVKGDPWKKIPDEVKRGGEAIQLILPGATLVVHILEQSTLSLDPGLQVTCVNPHTGKEEITFPFFWKDGTLLEPR